MRNRSPAARCSNRAVYRGAFAADPELTEIWMHAAYTLRLCRHHFLIDGVKRDRLPWVGDLALSLLANAYVFGDPAPVRRTLAVLGRAGIREQHLNGIVDYSLWFLICHDLYQRYWGDRDFLELQRRELVDHIEVLLEQSRSGIFLPSAGTHGFSSTGSTAPKRAPFRSCSTGRFRRRSAWPNGSENPPLPDAAANMPGS